MRLFKTVSIIISITFLIFIILETCFYFGRIYLNKDNVGFLINFNKSDKKHLSDKCKIMKTHPIINYTHFHNLECNVLGSSKYDEYFIWYENNSNFKNDKPIIILTSGGSTTDGFYQYISGGYTWPYQLQKICEKKFNCQVINGGTGGYSTTQEVLKLITYNHLIPKIDYIISLNGINDIRTGRRTSGDTFKQHPYLGKVQFTMLQDQIWIRQDKSTIDIFPNIVSFLNYYKYHETNINKINLLDKNEVYNSQNKKIKKDIKSYSAVWEGNINLMHNVSKTLNSNFISFLQPTMGLDYVKINYDKITKDIEMLNKWKNTKMNYQTNLLYNEIRKKCKIIYFCVDISEIAPPGDDLFFNARHHNSKGNKFIAEAIFKKIEKLEN